MVYSEESIQPRQTSGASLNVDDRDSAIIIIVGQDLDLRLLDMFLQAVGCVQRGIISRIVVDLSKTRRIFDSGVAMLMLINGRLSGRIRIINCNPDLKSRLTRGLSSAMFNPDLACRK